MLPLGNPSATWRSLLPLFFDVERGKRAETYIQLGSFVRKSERTRAEEG
jgi:hypothetical protein